MMHILNVYFLCACVVGLKRVVFRGQRVRAYQKVKKGLVLTSCPIAVAFLFVFMLVIVLVIVFVLVIVLTRLFLLLLCCCCLCFHHPCCCCFGVSKLPSLS